jgi:Secretion system C-terminal sorting domain
LDLSAGTSVFIIKCQAALSPVKKIQVSNMKKQFYLSAFSLIFLLSAFFLPSQLKAQGYIDMSTYLGGTGNESSPIIKVVNGETYVFGYTNSTNYPVTNGSTNAGNYDLVVTKLSANGNRLFSTYIGGSNLEQSNSMEIVNGEVYLFGYTISTNYPVTNSSTYTGSGDFVVTKLGANGAIVFSTYLGGSGADAPKSMQVVNGEIYLFGSTPSTNYPVTNGSTNAGGDDFVFTKLGTNGAILFSTYIGSLSNEISFQMEVVNGEVYLLGNTDGANYPVTNSSTLAGVTDFVVTKLGTNGAIIYSTYLGGYTNEFTASMQVENGNLYLFGQTNSSNYPVTNGSTRTGSNDFVVTKLGANGAIVYSTYIGGSSSETPANVQVENGEVYLFGQTNSTNYPVTNSSTNAGFNDFVVTKLGVTGAILFSTYIGGSSNETSKKIKVVNGEMYLFGQTTSANYPVTNGSIYVISEFVVTKLNSSGTICFSTFLGGANFETPEDLQVVNGDLYLSGISQSNNYPVTTGTPYRGGVAGDFVITKIKFCPVFSVAADPVAPASQSTCINGLVQSITGSIIRFPGSSMPTLYRNGAASQQNEIYPDYQWQKADAPGGPWADIAGAIQQNYGPSPTAINQYYRRIARQSPCCGNAIISTSDVAAVLVNSNNAPAANAGGVFNTCSSSAITIGGIPAASGGLAPYSYSWDNGAGATATPSVSPANTTIYTLTVTDALGCRGVDQAVVNTYSASAGPDVSNCAGAGVRIGTAPIAGLIGVANSWTAVPADPTMSCTNCAQPTVNPSATTTYTLTLTIPKTGGGTCVSNDAVIVTPVAAPVTPNFGGPDRTICIGGTSVLGMPSEAGFSYTWAPGNYLSANNIAQPTFQPGALALPNPNPITYYVTATKTGCAFVDEVVASVIEARAGLDGCGPGIIGEADRTPNINETYSWTKISGPGNFLGATNLPQVPVSASPGSQTVYQLQVSHNGVTCTDLVTVDVCGCPIITITVNAPNGCPAFGLNNGAVSLTANLGPGSDPNDFNFTWSPAAGLSGTTGQTVTITDNVPRTYTVTITSIYDPGFSCNQTIDVNNPAWSLPAFTAQDITTCPGTPVSIGQPNIAGYSYQWNNTVPGLNAYNISNPTATTSITRGYPVVVTDIVSGCLTKDTATVTILSSPANAGPDYTICSNAVIQLGSPAQPNTTYSWSPATAPWQNGTNEFSAQPEVLVATNLTFTLTATNTITGCVSVDAVDVVVNNSPTITAPDKTICYGSTATIGVAALPGVSYSWSPAAGLSCSNCAQPIASPATTTNYTVTATYPGGCNATDNVLVTVSNPSFTIPDINYCPSAGAFALAPTAPVGMTSYSWSPASQVTNAAIANPNTLNPPPSMATTYTLTVTNANGCSASDAVTIIPTISVPEAGNNRTVCLNSNTVLGGATNLASDIWGIVSGPNTSTAQLSCVTCAQPIFTPTLTGSYVLRISRTVTGCTSNATVSITVTGFSLPAIASPTICENACVQIGTTPQLGAQYFWSPATGLSNPNIANPIACMGTGNRNYTLTAVGVNGCATTTNVFVNVNPSLTPQIGIPPVVACLGDVGLAFNASVSPAGSYNYQWTPGNGTPGILNNIYIPNPQVNLTGLGSKQYRLTVTDPGTGCSNFADANLNVLYCLIVLPVKLESFTAEPQNDYVKLEWKVSEEINVAYYTVEFSTNGSNFISINSINATNLRNYSLLHSNPVYGLNYYRLKTTDKDGKVTYSEINKVNFGKSGGAIKIYPNPANNYIKIIATPGMINRSAVIRIIAIDGRVVLQKRVAKMSQQEAMDLSGVRSGKYLVHIITGKEVVTKLIAVIK